MLTCPLIKPIIAEWLALSKQSLSVWKRLPTAVVQLFDFNLDCLSNHFWVKVSDGIYWIPAVLNFEIANLYYNDHITNLDVVYLLRTSGHPYMGSGVLELVSF